MRLLGVFLSLILPLFFKSLAARLAWGDVTLRTLFWLLDHLLAICFSCVMVGAQLRSWHELDRV